MPARRGATTLLAAAGLALAALAAGSSPSPAAAPGPVHVLPDTVVNHRAPADVVQDVQSPSIAVNPRDARNLVIASRSDTPDFSCQIQVSTDGGVSWKPSTYPPPPRGTCWAPAAAFDDAGRAYVVTQNRPKSGSPQDIIVWSSGDGGQTFAPPVTVPGSSGDQSFSVQPSVTVDVTRTRHPNGPAVYVTWYAGPRFPVSNEVFVSYSEDGGATWSTPVFHAVPGEHQLQPTAAVGPEGNLYVVYKDTQNFQQTAPLDPSCPGGRAASSRLGLASVCPIRVLRSTDGGRSFDSSGPNGAAGFEAGIARYDASKPFDLAGGESPGIAVAPNGDVLVTYASLPAGTVAPGCRSDLDAFVTRSTDKGATWSPPVRVNDDPCGGGASQLDPWVSAGPDGRVDAVFYDNRNDPDRVLTDAYYARSTDGGRTFGPNRRLTDRSFDATIMFTPKTAGFQATEYDRNNGIVSTPDGAMAAWGDARNTLPESRSGDPTNTASDVFASAVVPGLSDLDRPARLAGGEPVAAAASLSQQTFSFANRVVLAPADDLLAALAGAPLARQGRGPVLLVPRGGGLPAAVRDEVARLKPKEAVLLGGPDVLAPAVESDLAGLGVTGVQRLAGADPGALSAQVAEQVGPGPGGAAVLVVGVDPGVALAAATFAASQRMPMLFTTSRALADDTLTALRRTGVTRTFVVGNAADVGDQLVGQLDAQRFGPVRVSGKTAPETAVRLAELDATAGPVPVPRNVVYVTAAGSALGDAATAPAVVAYRGGTLLLGGGGAAAGFVRDHHADIDRVLLVGSGASFSAGTGNGGISAAVVAGGAVAGAAGLALVAVAASRRRRHRAPAAAERVRVG